MAWIARPFNAVLMLATLAISFQHTASGLQNILEDYVNQEWARMGAILLEKTICALLWLASTLAVLRIAI